MNNKEDILRFLDRVSGQIDAGDEKKAKNMREKAEKMSEKRVKKFNKIQIKKEQEEEKLERKGQKKSKIETLKSKMKSGSMSNLSKVGTVPSRTSFSAIVNGNTLSSGKMLSTIQRKVLSKNNRLANMEDDLSEIEDGKRTISSLKGYRRDSEILYSGTLEPTRRGKLDGVFNEADQADIHNEDTPPPSNGMSRSRSQPDFLQQLREENASKEVHEAPASIFVRPGIGSIAFRKSITNNFSGFSGTEITTTEESSIGSGDSNFGQRNNLLSIDDELSDVESSEDENPSGPLERFLTAWGLGEYLSKFEDQKIDLETLMLLTENDLNSLNLPLGPYRKLVTAVNERKSALENPGEVVDSML
ncbi:hypothetical protein WA026_001633 [Henosepilachna vigintioctopunctata]|uniref:SAM domain-containing protein n=1 Tax=Henosepilachna vigintioctopunctata TaxID=420089 RepID=A0AAW1UQW9_9CUCU